MIPQPTAFASAGFSAAPGQSLDNSSGMTTAAVVMSFLNSLHPGYSVGRPDAQVEYPAFCAGLPDQWGHSLLQRTELAARVVCAYVGLPPEVVSFVGGLANFSAAARWLDSKRTEMVASKSVINDCEDHSDARRKQQRKTTGHRTLPKAAVALGAVSCLGVVGADEHWIEVNNANVLGKIGRDPAYPLDGRYRQTGAIDAGDLDGSIGNESHPFVGEYDGRCHMIKNLKHCFVKKLDGNGRLYNQLFVDARIESGEQAGVVACQVSGKAALGNIQVENSTVSTFRSNAPAGLATAVADSETEIDGFRADSSTVTTSQRNAHAGVVVGVAHGTVNNTRLVDSKVETSGSGADAGGVAGKVDGVIDNTLMLRGEVITHGDSANAGGGAGRAAAWAAVDNTALVSCELVTHEDLSHVGGGAGRVDENAMIANTLLIRTNLKTHGDDADAAGGAGSVSGDIINTTMVGGEASTQGVGAQAAVGGGEVFSLGRVDRVTGRHVMIRTSGINAEGGVGAGRADGVVTRTICFKSDILTSNSDADAAVGAGWVTGIVDEVISRDCAVITSGHSADAGFGAGDFGATGAAHRLAVLYSKVETSGNETRVGINGGKASFICGSAVGEYEALPCCDEHSSDSCLHIPGELCRHADLRVLSKECQPTEPPFIDTVRGEGFVCPAIPKPTTEIPESTLHAVTNSSTTPVSPGAAAVPGTAVVPGKLPLPTDANVNATAMPLMLSGSAAALSTGSVIGITLGVVGVCLLGGAIGFALYSRYYRNPERLQATVPLTEFDEL